MERLTTRGANCADPKVLYGVRVKNHDYISAANRLADYEDTGLTPEEIEKLRGQPSRWIPVEERLPEVWRNDETAELVNYMIYSPDFGVDIGNYHAKAKKWLCMALPCTVTHWAPLPEPPEVKL